MKKLLRGGFVVTPRGSRRADVLLDGEKIAQVGHISPAEAKSAEVTDVSGCYLFPGFIDAHTHFDLDVCNTTTADDFASGTRSAIRGGTTTIIDFACPNKGETLAYGLDLWHKKADGKCSCDYGFHMTIDDWNEGIEGELDDMFAAGITSFKMYLTYPAMMIGDGAVYSALKALKKRGGIAGVHCENAGVIDGMIAERKAAGELSPADHGPDLAGQLKQTQRIGDRRARLDDALRDLLLRQAIVAHQLLIALRFLDRVEVLSLKIFDEGELHDLALARLDDHRRNFIQTGLPRGTPSSLACDDLIIAFLFARTHRDRRDDAVQTDAFANTFLGWPGFGSMRLTAILLTLSAEVSVFRSTTVVSPNRLDRPPPSPFLPDAISPSPFRFSQGFHPRATDTLLRRGTCGRTR